MNNKSLLFCSVLIISGIGHASSTRDFSQREHQLKRKMGGVLLPSGQLLNLFRSWDINASNIQSSTEVVGDIAVVGDIIEYPALQISLKKENVEQGGLTTKDAVGRVRDPECYVAWLRSQGVIVEEISSNVQMKTFGNRRFIQKK